MTSVIVIVNILPLRSDALCECEWGRFAVKFEDLSNSARDLRHYIEDVSNLARDLRHIIEDLSNSAHSVQYGINLER